MSERSRWRLDTSALYTSLDVVRRAKGISWRDIATETGLSASTLTRLGQGTHPDADGLVSLLAWLGHADALAPYVEEVPGPLVVSRPVLKAAS